MAPVYDTDVAEERFAQEEWKHYELWEKVEGRLRRRKWMWILAACAVFLLLSSVPILFSKWPKWRSLVAARTLAEELNHLKTIAATEKKPFRLTITEPEGLAFEVYEVSSCEAPLKIRRAEKSSESPESNMIRKGTLLPPRKAGQFSVINEELAREIGLPLLRTSFCYDPLKGADKKGSAGGIGILPVNDLTDQRLDRLSLLYFSGESAEISFE